MQPIQMPNQVNWLDELKQLTKTVKPVLKQESACGILISSLAQRIELIYMYLGHIVIQEANFFSHSGKASLLRAQCELQRIGLLLLDLTANKKSYFEPGR